MSTRTAYGGLFLACLALGACSQKAPFGGIPATPAPSTSATASASATPSGSPTTGATATPIPSGSPTANSTATPVPSGSPTSGASATPVATATPTSVATATPAPTATPTPLPTALPTPLTQAFATCSVPVTSQPGSFSCLDSASDPANVSTGFSGEEGFALSNGTNTTPSIGSNFFKSNPGSFPVPGTVLAADQQTLTDTPAPLTLSASGYFTAGFAYSTSNLGGGSINMTPGESITCSIYDGSTLVGTATAVTQGSTTNGTSTALASCSLEYPTAGSAPSYEAVVIPPTGTYNNQDVYTFLISH